MKIISKYITALFVISIVFTACSEDFLDEVPKGQIDLESFYSTPIDAEIGLTGAYSRIISKHMMNNIFWLSISADEMTSANHAAVGIGAGDHRDIATSSPWGQLGNYTEPIVGVVNLNLLLQKVPDIPAESFVPGRKDELLGEAYFLRGFTHYMLAMVWRDVPLQLEVPTSSIPEENFMAKTEQSLVLDQALRDFKKAEELMPDRIVGMSDHDIRGRGSKWAAKGFQARIYMWREQWDSAYAECHEIITSSQFAITPRWIDIFAGEADNEEVIWQSQGQSREEYDFMGVYRWYCDSDPEAPAPPFMVEKVATDRFETPYKDVRLEYSVRAISRSSGFANYGGRLVKHFKVPSGEIIAGVTDESRDKNFPLMRLAEITLMKAEAIVQSGYTLGSADDVATILNELRARAADPDFDPREEDERYNAVADLGCEGIDPLLPGDVDLQAVKDEKARELMAEGIRYIDLLRWGKMEDNFAAVMAMVNAPNVDRLYWALPQQQIDANHGVLVQNPGY